MRNSPMSCSRDLPVGRVGDLGFHPVHQVFELRHAHRALLAGLDQPGQDLLAVELLPPAVLFDHHVGYVVDPLVSSEPALAGQAFAAAADGIAPGGLPGVHDFVFHVIAKWTLHDLSS